MRGGFARISGRSIRWPSARSSRSSIGTAGTSSRARRSASADRDGRADASPRGDEPGFVSVVDDTTLLVPDRRGNNRVDSFANILASQGVGLIFFVPGIGETLRVN